VVLATTVSAEAVAAVARAETVETVETVVIAVTARVGTGAESKATKKAAMAHRSEAVMVVDVVELLLPLHRRRMDGDSPKSVSHELAVCTFHGSFANRTWRKVYFVCLEHPRTIMADWPPINGPIKDSSSIFPFTPCYRW
jgi:hypothetical protein